MTPSKLSALTTLILSKADCLHTTLPVSGNTGTTVFPLHRGPGFPAEVITSDDEPMPPTVLFRPEMKAIEAQQRVKQVERLMKDDIVAA
jgi:hypothetical protein